MTMSIMHRITGGALYFGTLLVAWWLIAAATSRGLLRRRQRLFGSWFGRLVLLGYTWALMHHMLGGMRHLIWDTGAGLEKHTASRLAWATLAGSIVLTLADLDRRLHWRGELIVSNGTTCAPRWPRSAASARPAKAPSISGASG